LSELNYLFLFHHPIKPRTCNAGAIFLHDGRQFDRHSCQTAAKCKALTDGKSRSGPRDSRETEIRCCQPVLLIGRVVLLVAMAWLHGIIELSRILLLLLLLLSYATDWCH